MSTDNTKGEIRAYTRGRTYLARLDGHPELVHLVSIEISGMNAGGGLLLVKDHGNGTVDRLVKLLNDVEKFPGGFMNHQVECEEDAASCDCLYHDNLRAAEASHEDEHTETATQKG